MSATQIVTINVSVQIAPAPNTLQKTGALLSQGATTTAVDTKTLLTELGDLDDILAAPTALASLTWSGSVVTAVTSAPHGWTTGASFSATIAGAAPTGYNGTFTITVTGTTGFTYPLVSNPGSETVPGTVIPASVAELTAMATTFFAQGNSVSVYVLELAAGSAAAGVTALTSYITANPNAFYSYLVPRAWASESTFRSYLASFESTTAKTYFWITATTGNYTSFTSLEKCAFILVEAPSIPVTEFSLAAAFYKALGYAPSTTNQVTPFAYSFLFGVTPYPTEGNNALLAAFKAAFTNIIGTGAEGGISNTILYWGTTRDGRDFTYWYSVDWTQINLELDLANAIIDGSNNPLAPLYYNQNGINRLQARAQSTMNRGTTFGMVLGIAPVNAVPFATYVADNPSDFPDGVYNGISVTFTPQRGFKSITMNLVVSDFPLGS